MSFVSDMARRLANFLRGASGRRLSRADMEDALEHADVGIALVGPAGGFLWANRRFHEIHGYTPGEFARMNVSEITHPEDRERLLNKQQSLLQGRASRFFVEKRNRRKDGSEIWVRMRSTLLRHADGRPRFFVCVMEDITEQRKMEFRQRESREKYRALFDLIPVGMVISDAHGQIVEANPASERLLGLPVEKQKQQSLGGEMWRIVKSDGSPMRPEEFPSVRALHEGCASKTRKWGFIAPTAAVRG